MKANIFVVIIVILVAGFYLVNGTPSQYQVSVTVVGQGTVVKTPDKPLYDYGDVVTLVPTASPGNFFAGWSGDLTGDDVPGMVVVDSGKNIVATFTSETPPPNDYEDFSTYTENDPDNCLNIFPTTPHIINVVNIRRDSQSYIRKAITFDDFDITMTLSLQSIQHNINPDGIGAWIDFFGVARSSESTTFTGFDGLAAYAYEYTNALGVYQYAIYIRDCERFTQWTGEEHVTYDGWIFHQSAVPGLPETLTYYCNFVRDTSGYGSFYCHIYSDEEQTTLLKTLNLFGSSTNPMSAANYNYLLPAFGHNNLGAPSLTASGIISNYKL